MTEAVKPPISKPDPITEGVQARLRHFRDVANAFCSDLREMERLEKTLLAALDRLDRHTSLMGTETQLLEQLLKRERAKALPRLSEAQGRGQPPAEFIGEASVVSIVDKVEQDLAALIVDAKAS